MVYLFRFFIKHKERVRQISVLEFATSASVAEMQVKKRFKDPTVHGIKLIAEGKEARDRYLKGI